MLIRCLSTHMSRRGVQGFAVFTCENTWQTVMFARPIWQREGKKRYT